jgi:hypothetical protein
MTIIRVVLETIGSITRAQGGWCLPERLIHLAQVERQNATTHVAPRSSGLLQLCCHGEESLLTRSNSEFKRSGHLLRKLMPHDCGASCFGFLGTGSMEAFTGNIFERIDTRACSRADFGRLRQNRSGTLRKPAGLTKEKAASIVDLALHFQEGKYSEHFLKTTIDETEIRKAPLQVLLATCLLHVAGCRHAVAGGLSS